MTLTVEQRLVGESGGFEAVGREIPFDHIWFWKPSPMRPIDRKGQFCRVLVRGRMNTILVEFEDGFQVVVSRYAVRQRNRAVDGKSAGAWDRAE